MPEFELSRGGRISAAMQHVYPKRLLSKLMFSATRVRFKPYKNWQIQWFIRRYGVDINEALENDPLAYPEFNTFFTRPLKPESRPLPDAENALGSPADGHVLECGEVTEGRLLQVKGVEMDLVELLGGDREQVAPFLNGQFATVYLSPRDYHRVHMPIDGVLRAMAYVPGELFSVSLNCAHGIPGLFTRNERVVSFFDTPAGPMALILVGAVFVGCIETIWAGAVSGPRRQVTWQHYDVAAHPVSLRRGQEMGRFNMGSTVIAVFGGDAVNLADNLLPGDPVTMGQHLGDFQSPQ
jgi:phosphatidylserine decarboxylase